MRSNIIQAYRQMLDFVVKYLPDKLYLPDNGSTARLDLRVQIFREFIGNICTHSDNQPGFGGYDEVFYDCVITNNATRLIPTMKEDCLTLDELALARGQVPLNIYNGAWHGMPGLSLVHK